MKNILGLRFSDAELARIRADYDPETYRAVDWAEAEKKTPAEELARLRQLNKIRARNAHLPARRHQPKHSERSSHRRQRLGRLPTHRNRRRIIELRQQRVHIG